jgi:hypothetical protein
MIYCNGCSFTEGFNLNNPANSWPAVLGQELNQSVINQASGGGSNDRIYRTTIEYCNTHVPDYVIIGWTTNTRNELSHTKGTYLRLAPKTHLADDSELPDNLESIHKFWLQHVYNEYINFRNMVHYILHLQDYFKSKKITYRFFTALGQLHLRSFLQESPKAFELAQQSFYWKQYRNDFDPEPKETHVKYQELKDLVKKIDLNNWIMHDTTMFDYLKNNNYQIDQTGHPGIDGHAQWATVIKEIL